MAQPKSEVSSSERIARCRYVFVSVLWTATQYHSSCMIGLEVCSFFIILLVNHYGQIWNMLGHPCIHFIIKAAVKYTFGIHVHLGHLGYPPFPRAWVGCDINPVSWECRYTPFWWTGWQLIQWNSHLRMMLLYYLTPSIASMPIQITTTLRDQCSNFSWWLLGVDLLDFTSKVVQQNTIIHVGTLC